LPSIEQDFFHSKLISHLLLLARNIHASFCSFSSLFGQLQILLYSFPNERFIANFSFFSFALIFPLKLLYILSIAHEFMPLAVWQEHFLIIKIVFIFHGLDFTLLRLIQSLR
jgi:hypothetical protein